jgi:hypothetical protein
MRRGCARFATSRRSSHLASGRPHATPSALATMTMKGAAGGEGGQGRLRRPPPSAYWKWHDPPVPRRRGAATGEATDVPDATRLPSAAPQTEADGLITRYGVTRWQWIPW